MTWTTPSEAWAGTTNLTDTEPPEICPYFVADPAGLCEYCGDPANAHTAKALGQS